MKKDPRSRATKRYMAMLPIDPARVFVVPPFEVTAEDIARWKDLERRKHERRMQPRPRYR
jgi:hypothetical protein